jgi:type II secretory pathway component PulJ
MKNNRLNQGYSLIELLVYITIFVFISIILINALVTIMRTHATSQAYRRLQHNGELVLERMTRETREASSVDSGSVLDTNPGVLILSGTDSGGSARTVTFSVSDGAVQINDNGTSGNLTSDEVTVTSLIFRSVTTVAGTGVKVELQLSTANGYSASAPFYTTVMLRDN